MTAWKNTHIVDFVERRMCFSMIIVTQLTKPPIVLEPSNRLTEKDRYGTGRKIRVGRPRQGTQSLVVFRCLVWVIAKLTHVWDVQIELTGSMVGYSSEVDEVFKSPSHSFC